MNPKNIAINGNKKNSPKKLYSPTIAEMKMTVLEARHAVEEIQEDRRYHLLNDNYYANLIE